MFEKIEQAGNSLQEQRIARRNCLDYYIDDLGYVRYIRYFKESRKPTDFEEQMWDRFLPSDFNTNKTLDLIEKEVLDCLNVANKYYYVSFEDFEFIKHSDRSFDFSVETLYFETGKPNAQECFVFASYFIPKGFYYEADEETKELCPNVLGPKKDLSSYWRLIIKADLQLFLCR